MKSSNSTEQARVVIGVTGAAALVGLAELRLPIHLPGHRALAWVAVLIAARLLAGRGWGALVGCVAAAAVFALGLSPNGVLGAAQYAAAGIALDLVLAVRPDLGRRPIAVAGLGAALALATGWMAPLGQSLGSAVGAGGAGGGGGPLAFALMIVFGAAGGLMAWGLVGLSRKRQRSPALSA